MQTLHKTLNRASVGLIQAFNTHLRLEGEDMKAFASQVVALSDPDRQRYAILFAELGVVVKPETINRPILAATTVAN